jgi:hypothetical protein
MVDRKFWKHSGWAGLFWLGQVNPDSRRTHEGHDGNMMASFRSKPTACVIDQKSRNAKTDERRSGDACLPGLNCEGWSAAYKKGSRTEFMKLSEDQFSLEMRP